MRRSASAISTSSSVRSPPIPASRSCRSRQQHPHRPQVPLGNAGPDDIVLSVIGSGGPQELARLDGRYLSTEVASGFTGRMLALGSTTVPALVRSVSYHATTTC